VASAPLGSLQTTNLLIEAGMMSLDSQACDIPELMPLMEIKQLHHEAMDLLEVDDEAREEVPPPFFATGMFTSSRSFIQCWCQHMKCCSCGHEPSLRSVLVVFSIE
jgi:hypothetical protein